MFQLAEDSTPALSLGDKSDWGVLALLLKYPARPDKEGDNHVWIVQRPLDTGDKNAITFKLTFDDPGPDVLHWPKE